MQLVRIIIRFFFVPHEGEVSPLLARLGQLPFDGVWPDRGTTGEPPGAEELHHQENHDGRQGGETDKSYSLKIVSIKIIIILN